MVSVIVVNIMTDGLQCRMAELPRETSFASKKQTNKQTFFYFILKMTKRKEANQDVNEEWERHGDQQLNQQLLLEKGSTEIAEFIFLS